MKKVPEIAVGAIIFNKKNEILLIKSPKYKNKWMVPGGHVEFGEPMTQALKREIKEEVGIEIENIEYFNVEESIFNKEVSKNRHFIFIDFICKAKTFNIKLDKSEATEYVWKKTEQALKITDIGNVTKNFITFYLVKSKEQYLKHFKRLYEIEKELREKCPWDKKQTIESMKNDFLEEAQEVAQAIEKKDYENLSEEIGDVFQTLMLLIRIGQEKNILDLNEILEKNNKKMIRRHPHVFGELKDKNLTVEQVLENWKKIKQKEKVK
jgi:mutator protein MutT